MKVVKEIISLAAMLVVFIISVSLLTGYSKIYQKAYQGLSRKISHPSISSWQDINEGEEQ